MRNGAGDSVGQALGVLHDAASLARAPTARGLRAQVIGDGWHHTAVKI